MARTTDQFESKQVKDIQEYAQQLKSVHSKRNTMFDALEKAYLMNWDEEKRLKDRVEHVKITRSPDFRNKILGAVRLLIATDPAFSIPKELNTEDTMEVADGLEQAADRIYKA